MSAVFCGKCRHYHNEPECADTHCEGCGHPRRLHDGSFCNTHDGCSCNWLPDGNPPPPSPLLVEVATLLARYVAWAKHDESCLGWSDELEDCWCGLDGLNEKAKAALKKVSLQ